MTRGYSCGMQVAPVFLTWRNGTDITDQKYKRVEAVGAAKARTAPGNVRFCVGCEGNLTTSQQAADACPRRECTELPWATACSFCWASGCVPHQSHLFIQTLWRMMSRDHYQALYDCIITLLEATDAGRKRLESGRDRNEKGSGGTNTAKGWWHRTPP